MYTGWPQNTQAETEASLVSPRWSSLINLTCIGSSWLSLQHLGSEEAGEGQLYEQLPKQRGHKLSVAYRTGGECPNAAGHGDFYPSHRGCSGWAPLPSDISRLHDDTRILRWCPHLSRDTGTKDSEREQLSLCLEVISHVTFSIWEEEIMLAQGQQIKLHEQHRYHLEKETLRKVGRVEFHLLWLEAWIHPTNVLGIKSWVFFLPSFSVPGLREMPCGLWCTAINLRGRGLSLQAEARCPAKQSGKEAMQKEIFKMNQMHSAVRHRGISEESEQNSSSHGRFMSK